MEIYEVNGKFFRSYDMAVLEGINTHYNINIHRLNDRKEVEVERQMEEVFLIYDDYDEVIVTFDVEQVNVNIGTEQVAEYYATNIRLKGEELYSIDISKKLIDAIEHEVDNSASRYGDALRTKLSTDQ